MSFNGSGTYQLPAGQPVVTGTTISSSTHNTLANDLATALSLCMTKDGQQTPTANIKFGGYRLTNVGAATDVADAARASQVQNSSLSYLSSVAGTNTITASATPTPAAYAAGQRFVFIPANTSTGAATLNVSSLGAKDIFYKGAALIGGELRANVPVSVIYDGTQFNIETAYSRKVQSRSSDTVLGVGDRESVLIATAGYTQTLAAAATLGDGWFIDVIVDSGATLVIDPNSSETIDGATTKSIVGPAQGRLVCNGTLFRTIGFASVQDASDTVKGIIEIADQTEMEAGSSSIHAVTPGRQQFHPSAVKFWVKANGSSGSVDASYNVTGTTDHDSGTLGVTIATDFSSANWCAQYSTIDTNQRSLSLDGSGTYGAAQAAGGCITLCIASTGAPTRADPSNHFVSGMGDQ